MTTIKTCPVTQDLSAHLAERENELDRGDVETRLMDDLLVHGIACASGYDGQRARSRQIDLTDVFARVGESDMAGAILRNAVMGTGTMARNYIDDAARQLVQELAAEIMEWTDVDFSG
jgi:hypothetical protein